MIFVLAKKKARLTLRYIGGLFTVTAPGLIPVEFKTRLQAKNWCALNHPRSPIHEVGEGARNGQLDRRMRRTDH